MINELVDLLIPYYEDLPFKDVLKGLVKPVKTMKGDAEKIYPVVYNLNPTTCESSELISLVPNSSKMSIIYFEDVSGVRLIGEVNRFIIMEATIKLICWFNLEKINQDEHDSSKIALNLLNRMPDKLANHDPFIGTLITFNGQDSRATDPFSKYTYDEVRTQFMTYPYDFVSLNFNLEWMIRPECIEDIVINPKTC